MEFINKLLGRATPFKRNRLGEIEVLIHKDARHHAAHGFVVASNKALKIKKAAVAVVFPDLEDAPDLTHTVMTDLWEAMISQGWVPQHIAAWGTVGMIASEQPSGADEHVEEGFQTPGFSMSPAAAEIPAYLRRQAEAATNVQQGYEQVITPGVLSFPRADRAQSVPVRHTVVRAALDEAMKSVSHLDTMAREAAAVRFEAIAHNGTALGVPVGQTAQKIKDAARVILDTHAQNAGTMADAARKTH